MTAEAPFRYRLRALLQRDRWEGELLGAEAGNALRALDECKRREREAEDGVARTLAELRGLLGSGQPLMLERRRILDLFLRHQYAQVELRRHDRAGAEAVVTQVLQQLERKQRSIKAMENHEQRQRISHHSEQARLAFKAYDDAWLVRHARSEAQP